MGTVKPRVILLILIKVKIIKNEESDKFNYKNDDIFENLYRASVCAQEEKIEGYGRYFL